MRKWLILASATWCLMLTTGCARLTTYTRPIDLKDQSYAMDVKQRVVFSQKRRAADGSPLTVVCAEPSPDALTVIGVSGGLSLNSARIDTAGNLGGALSENGAFVGLRTHSIQLLRDAMYRLCEGYAADAVSAQTFQSMQRRYQSTMMGLIAIEQLTGPVVASQALLTTAAASQSGVSMGDVAIEKAQERVDLKSEGLLAAQTKADEANAKTESASKKLQAANRALLNARAKKEPDESTVEQLAGEVESAKEALAAARRERDAALRNLTVAEESFKSATQHLIATQSRVSASAGGTGKLGDIPGGLAASTESLKDGVVKIVQEINISYLRDFCVGFSSDLLHEPELLKKLQGLSTANPNTTVSPVRMVQSLIGVCQTLLTFDAKRLAGASGTSEQTIKEVLKMNSGSPENLGPAENDRNVPADSPRKPENR